MRARQGLILYGPPASGKSSITKALTALDPSYQLYERLKIGTGRTEGYCMTTQAELERLRQSNQVLWENTRYGATYAIDRPRLLKAMELCSPVVHLGQPEGVHALLTHLPEHFAVVALECSRIVARARLVDRRDTDLEERLTVWDQTAQLTHANLRIDTTRTSPQDSAKGIASHHWLHPTVSHLVANQHQAR